MVAAAYDPTRGAVIAVVDDTIVTCCATTYDGTQTWSWNGQAWQQLAPVTEPIPNMAPTLIAGCADISCVGPAFEPFEIANDAAVWDPARQRIVLVRGGMATWTWDGSNWAQLGVATPTDTSTVSLAYDPAVTTDLLYGEPSHTDVLMDGAWTPVATTGLQPPVGVVADDPQLGGVVLLADTVGVRTQPALLWRFTPGFSAP